MLLPLFIQGERQKSSFSRCKIRLEMTLRLRGKNIHPRLYISLVFWGQRLLAGPVSKERKETDRKVDLAAAAKKGMGAEVSPFPPEKTEKVFFEKEERNGFGKQSAGGGRPQPGKKSFILPPLFFPSRIFVPAPPSSSKFGNGLTAGGQGTGEMDIFFGFLSHPMW